MHVLIGKTPTNLTARLRDEQGKTPIWWTGAALLISVAGCNVQGVVSSTGSTTAADSTSAASVDTVDTNASTEPSTSADSTDGAADSTGDVGEPPASCLSIDEITECPTFPTPTQSYEPEVSILSGLEPGDICPCTSEGYYEGPLVSIIVEHPAGWPSDPATAPVIVFHHGQLQFAEFYDFSALASAGFVVLNVETDPGNGGNAHFGLLCALEFAS